MLRKIGIKNVQLAYRCPHLTNHIWRPSTACRWDEDKVRKQLPEGAWSSSTTLHMPYVYLLSEKWPFVLKLRSEEWKDTSTFNHLACKWNEQSEAKVIDAHPRSCKNVVVKLEKLITVYSNHMSKHTLSNSLAIRHYVQVLMLQLQKNFQRYSSRDKGNVANIFLHAFKWSKIESEPSCPVAAFSQPNQANIFNCILERESIVRSLLPVVADSLEALEMVEPAISAS